MKKPRRYEKPFDTVATIRPGACRVCRSPNRQDYEGKLAASWSYRALERYSVELGDKIGVTSFRNHDRRHFRPQLERGIERSEKAEELARSRVKLGIEAVAELRANLECLRGLRAQVTGTQATSASMMHAVARVLQELRMTERELVAALAKIHLPQDIDETALASDLSTLVHLMCPQCRERVAQALGIGEVDNPEEYRQAARRVL